MENGNSYKDISYLTYNGLNRPAMIFGSIPLMLCIAVMTLFLFFCLPLFAIFGAIVGGIPTVALIAILVIAKMIGEGDPNAIYVVQLKMKGQALFGLSKILGVRG